MELNDTIWEAVAGMCMGFGIPVPQGTRHYVDGNAADAADDADHGKNWTSPYATLDYANGQCTANAGDVIIVAANHAETIGGAGGLDLDTEGITIIGLGNGDNRPTFTFSGAAGADVDIDADNVTVCNMRFINTEDGLTGAFDVNAAYFSIIGCEFEDDGTDNTTDWFVLDGNATDCLIRDAINKGTDTAGNHSFISIQGTCDHVRIINVVSNGNFSAANIEFTAAATDVLIEDCTLENSNAVDVNIEGFASVTGWVRRCSMRLATDGQASWVHTPGSLTVYDCWGASANGEQAVPVQTSATEYYNQLLSAALSAWGKPVPSGKRFWVDSTTGTDGTGYGHRPEMPVATVDYAVALCTANKGDLILVMPGHAETLATAGAIDADIEGITILGLGNGDNVPTFTFDTSTGASVDIDADNVTISNVRFLNTMDACVAPIDVNAAYCALIGCEFEDDDADNTVDWIMLSTGANDFLCRDCINKGTDTGGNDSFISTAAAVDHIRIQNLVSNGNFAQANIDLSPAACTDVLIEDCKLENDNETADRCIQGNAAMTGWVCETYMFLTADAETTWFETPGKTGTFECYGVNDDGEAGKFVGTVSV